MNIDYAGKNTVQRIIGNVKDRYVRDASEITMEDIAQISGDFDIETGTGLTLAGILGEDISESDIDAIVR